MSIVNTLGGQFKKIFGTRNDRVVKSYAKRAELIDQFKPEMRGLTDDLLRDRATAIRARSADGERPDQWMNEALAVMRESLDRSIGMRSMFNPEHKDQFPVDQLTTSERALYDRVAAEVEATEPIEEIGCADLVPAHLQVTMPNELYDAARRIFPQSRPPFRTHPFLVQLVGGMVLYEGNIAEMKTGEGKTIVAPLACFLATMEGLKCHVVTVNDYLVQRDRDWVFPAFYKLGITVGAIHPFHMQEGELKKEAYNCDVTYGTNSEFGFDFLRDNMKLSAEDQVQKRRDFCIVDEIDSILIDEARTPLIISGPAHDDAPQYLKANKVAEQLILLQKGANKDTAQRIKADDFANDQARFHKVATSQIEKVISKFEDLGPEFLDDKEAEFVQHVQYFVVKKESKQAAMTHIGVDEAQNIVGVRFYVVGNDMAWDHLINNAVRAHAVYEIDREYVVQDGKVVIVDESTGRLMIGRQWSDGLHQAIEAKESHHGVKIEEESQTLATVTIQNFFKLYKRLAGMTGTAITEAHEFHEIYKLDVICIPTNRPVIRNDANDLIFLNEAAKWNAITDEIRKTHDLGRPVLVGTTSVEKSEMLSQLLTKKHNVTHSVLNAKQHEREASIIESAGQLGAVVIATNMAGRGTDIKLGLIDRKVLLAHWKERRILPTDATEHLSDDELVELAYRHMGEHTLGLKRKEIEALGPKEVRLALMRHWVESEAMIKESKAQSMGPDDCEAMLDQIPSFILHRLTMFSDIKSLGGLHIVGTERHEARRIDNQLRGRSGRQGDNGSSRFFISMEDDLMKMFAGKTTMKALSYLGMEEDDAIEHKWVTKSVEKAQTKVEQRNFQIRKSLLEYDEVMEYQRTAFYATRQSVLEGRDIKSLIFEYIVESIEDAVGRYLGVDYVQTQVAEAARSILGAYVEPGRLRGTTLGDVETVIRSDTKADIRQDIEKSVGEYLTEEQDPRDWDAKGLGSWAKSRFGASLKHADIRRSTPDEITDQLIEVAHDMIDHKNLDSLSKYYEGNYIENELSAWAREKFGLELTPEELRAESGEPPQTHQSRVADLIYDRAESAYRRREIEYPCQFMLEMVAEAMTQGEESGLWAAGKLVEWANTRYDLNWTLEEARAWEPDELYRRMVEAAESWTNGKLSEWVQRATASNKDVAAISAAFESRWGEPLPDKLPEDPEMWADAVSTAAAGVLRTELTQLEQYVLLQILDQSWKDHLYAMDQLKDSVGLHGYAEKDPKIVYKTEGAGMYLEMLASVRDHATDLIFKARLTANVQVREVFHDMIAEHEVIEDTGASATAALGSEQQMADLEAAERAGAEGADARPAVETIVNETERTGRNAPCPCGSGKKYKKCCGQDE